MVVSVRDGNITIEIDLGRRYEDTLPLIIRIMKKKKNSSKKQSETSNIIVLANFSKTKNIKTSYDHDVLGKIERIMTNSSGSLSIMRKELKSSNRKIKKIIKTKLKRRFLNHAEYLKNSIKELKTLPLSEAFQISNMHLNDFIKRLF